MELDEDKDAGRDQETRHSECVSTEEVWAPLPTGPVGAGDAVRVISNMNHVLFCLWTLTMLLTVKQEQKASRRGGGVDC